jgi:organic radical activating enzyme
MSASRIADMVNHKHVVITGGEPLIHHLDHLIRQIGYKNECFIQLETSGAFPWKGIERVDFVTVSPKKNNDFKIVVAPDEVKFVVDDDLTDDIVVGIMEKWEHQADFAFMPEGAPPTLESRKRCYDMVMRFAQFDVMYSERVQYVVEVE